MARLSLRADQRCLKGREKLRRRRLYRIRFGGCCGRKLKPIPMDDGHRHFGNGQTEAMITLPPGPHKLQLVLGNWSHIPHTPPVMSDVITVTVR